MGDAIFKYPFAPEILQEASQFKNVMPDAPPPPLVVDFFCDWCNKKFEFGEPVLEVFDGVLVHSKKDYQPIVENFPQGQGFKRLHPGTCFEDWYIRCVNDMAPFASNQDESPVYCAACESKLFGEGD